MTNDKTTIRRLTTIWASAALALLFVPHALALHVDEESATFAGAVPAPDALGALTHDLLGFGTSPMVDACNTQPIDASIVPGVETWWAEGNQGRYTAAMHNGHRVPVEELERALYENRGEGWVEDAIDLLKECAKGGGFCFCASVVAFPPKAVACASCCPSGSMPFCLCSGAYMYASCGCYK